MTQPSPEQNTYLTHCYNCGEQVAVTEAGIFINHTCAFKGEQKPEEQKPVMVETECVACSGTGRMTVGLGFVFDHYERCVYCAGEGKVTRKLLTDPTTLGWVRAEDVVKDLGIFKQYKYPELPATLINSIMFLEAKYKAIAERR